MSLSYKFFLKKKMIEPYLVYPEDGSEEDYYGNLKLRDDAPTEIKAIYKDVKKIYDWARKNMVRL